MTDQAIKLMSEIRQFREQYVAEVGKGRRVWPKSIRDRIEELEKLNVPTKLIASQTGVGYDTILTWRYQRNQKFKKSFHQLDVKSASSPHLPSPPLASDILKVGTVTVPKPNLAPGVPSHQSSSKLSTVTVTTPNGYRIESDNPDTLRYLLVSLREA